MGLDTSRDEIIWKRWAESLLALTLWREARNQSDEAIAAVACSIRNRVDHPGWWGTNWISVLTQKFQYSSLTDPKDRQLSLFPKPTDASFIRCYNIAIKTMSREMVSPVPGADSYYDDSIKPPYWATPETFVKKVGAFSFHNVDHDFEIVALSEMKKGVVRG